MLKNKELAKKIGDIEGVSITKAESILETLAGIIKEELLEGNKIRILGVGTFSTKVIEARNGVNPRTKEKTINPAYTKLCFSGYASLKDSVKQR